MVMMAATLTAVTLTAATSTVNKVASVAYGAITTSLDAVSTVLGVMADAAKAQTVSMMTCMALSNRRKQAVILGREDAT